MISRIIDFSVHNKFIIGLLVVTMSAFGIYSMMNLPVDAVPDITNNQVQVVTVTPSLAPQEVEQFITYPIEIAMANIPDVEDIRSISRFGLSVVTIVFKDKVPILDARQFVKEQIGMAEADIPEELGRPELMPITTGLGEIYQYTLQVDSKYENEYDPMELRTIQDWIVKRQLSGIPGIIEVSSFGGFLKQYEVAVDPVKLQNFRLTISEVFDALEKNNQNSGGSYIEKGPNAYYIRTEGLIRDIGDIEKIVISNINQTPILIKNVAEVKWGYPPRFGAMTMDGKGETVGGITLMLKGGNSSMAIKNVHERVELIQKSLPRGVRIEPYLDRSVLVSKTIGTVSKNLIEGGLIVIFILILLLGNLRAGLIVASVIPLSMLFAFIMMRLFGVSANLMSLGAIDFGIVIDGAVIIVEGILHLIYTKYLGKKLSHKEMDEVVIKTSSSIIKSAAFGVLIILVVFIPIMTLQGIEGKTFVPMAQTVSFAVFGALLLSVTYVPMMAALVLNRNIKKDFSLADNIINLFKKWYEPTLNLALKIPKLMVLAVVLMLFVSVFIFSRLGAEFVPTLEEGDLAMQMTIKPGSSLSESIKTSTKAEKILIENFPEVLHVVSKIGTAEVPTDPMAVEDADVMIILKEKDEWESASTREGLVELMKEKLTSVKGASFEFTQPIQLRFNELMTGTKTDVAVKIFGEDVAELTIQANLAANIISKIQGAGDVKVEQTEGLPQMMIYFNRDKVAMYGLNIKELNRIIRTAYAGETAGTVYEGEKRFDLTVRLKGSFRNNLELGKLFVSSAHGNIIPLSEVAEMKIVEGPMQISREDAKRRVSVGVNIRDRDVGTFIAEVRTNLEQQLHLKPGYFIHYGGQFENLEAAKKRLAVAVPVALLLIFVLLYLAFNSFKYALLIYSTVPLAAMGGVMALFTRGMPFSISAGVGFIALFGVAVLNGIVLISYYNQLRTENNMDLKKLVIKGGTVRMRPVIMTAAVASLGFLPMALSTSAGAEVQKPLATVVIGGLITSTFLTLIFLPVLYYLVENRKKYRKAALPLILALFGLFSFERGSTQEINLSMAIDSTITNNFYLQNAELNIEQAKLKKQSSLSLGTTNLNYLHGQINTGLPDNYWLIDQNLGNLLKQFKQSGESKAFIDVRSSEFDLIRKQLIYDLKLNWYEYIYSNQLIDLFEEHILAFSEYLPKARLKEEAGEISKADLFLIEVQLSNLDNELTAARIMQNEKLIRLREISQIKGELHPVEKTYGILPYKLVDTAGITIQLLNYQRAKVAFSDKMVKTARSEFFPELSVGYFNQSINEVRGFQGVTAGLRFPLWFVPKSKEVKMARINAEIARNEYNLTEKRINLQYESHLDELQEYLNLYNKFGVNWEGQLEVLLDKAGIQLDAGEIDYYRFMQLYAQAIEMELNRLKLINNINQTIIHLEYYQDS